MSTSGSLLQALACHAGSSLPALKTTPQEVGRLIDNGLGPLAFHAMQLGRIAVEPEAASTLRAADMTARVISHQWDIVLHGLIGRLNEAQILPVLLKGASLRYRHASRHHRLLGDIDLLVEPEQIDTTISILDSLGFVAESDEPASHWLSHHHVAPRRHAELGVWIEVHTGLDSSAWFQSLNRYTDARHLEPVGELPAGLHARCLNRQVELRYIAAHWYLHLIENLGTHGLQRAIVDASVLLSSGKVQQAVSTSHLTPADHAAARPVPGAGRRKRDDESSVSPDASVDFATVTLLTTLDELGVLELDALQRRDLAAGSGIDDEALALAVRLVMHDVISMQPPHLLIHQMIHANWLELALTSTRPDRLRLRQATGATRLLARAVEHHARALFTVKAA